MPAAEWNRQSLEWNVTYFYRFAYKIDKLGNTYSRLQIFELIHYFYMETISMRPHERNCCRHKS